MTSPRISADLVRWLLLIWFAFPALVFAQVSEEDDLETMTSSEKAAHQPKAPDLAQVAKLIVQKTNEFRRDEGLENVQPNQELTETAKYFADYMAKTDRYGHQADGKRPSERAKQHGYEYCLVAENIAYQFSSAGFAAEELGVNFFDGWKSSPPHRKNMLNSAVTETGVAVAQSEQTGYFYGVQMFGRPKALQIEFQVANRADVDVEYRLGDRTFTLRPRFTRTHIRCRPTELTLQPQDKSQLQRNTVLPNDDDRFVITGAADQLTIHRE